MLSFWPMEFLSEKGQGKRRTLRRELILVLFAAFLGFALVLGYGLWGRSQSAPFASEPIPLPPPPPVDATALVTVLERDSIPSIDDPQFETAEAAQDSLKPDERVVGLVIDGDARSYPIPVLSAHEIVNDVVGGEPVAITWCPLCYTSLVFSRRVAGMNEPLTFGVSGKLLYDTLVMQDRQTDSLWSQLYGAAVGGPLKGESLAIYPSLHTRWSAWREAHPDTLVLSKRLTCEQFNCGTYASNPRGSYRVDPYISYYNSTSEGVTNDNLPRDAVRASGKTRVLGVRVSSGARAYPVNAIKKQTLVNDSINGTPILVWYDPQTQTGTAYLRRIGDRVLIFEPAPESSDILLDVETGTRWQAFTGEAIDGPLRGEVLESVFSTLAFEFGWTNYFPKADTYTPLPEETN